MGREKLGEIVGVKLQPALKFAAAGLAGLGLLLASGCGSSSNGANVVSVTVIPVTDTLILGQSVNLTATVTGANNTMVKWSPCQYTTTTTTNGKTTTSALTDCPSDGSFGTLSNQSDTGTAVYTAPDPTKFQLPDQTKYPQLQIVITATSQQDAKKSNKCTITLIAKRSTRGFREQSSFETFSGSIGITRSGK